MGKITEEQKKLIEEFSCERLSSNEENKVLIKNFVSEKGELLVRYLQELAWEEDTKGITAFYLIKHKSGEIAAFFSLKCGTMFDSLNEEGIKLKAQAAKTLLKIVNLSQEGGEQGKNAIKALENLMSSQNIPKEQGEKIIKMKAEHALTMLNNLEGDKANERNELILRVGNTYPGIEIAHFCVNDNARNKWNSLGFQQPLGEVMFWMYIVPIIYKVQEKVGCQYAFLFAADISENRSLINYYNVALKFEQPKEFGTNKPIYDLCCEFMCQEVNKMKKHRIEYFNNFNPDEDDIIV